MIIVIFVWMNKEFTFQLYMIRKTYWNQNAKIWWNVAIELLRSESSSAAARMRPIWNFLLRCWVNSPFSVPAVFSLFIVCYFTIYFDNHGNAGFLKSLLLFIKHIFYLWICCIDQLNAHFVLTSFEMIKGSHLHPNLIFKLFISTM